MDPKEIANQIKTAFEQFKVANDQRLAEIEKRGEATAETTAIVDKANAAITELQNKLDESNQRVDDLENRMNRPGASSRIARPSDEQMAVYARWQSVAQRKPVDAGSVDLELVGNYNRAFDQWVRHGDRAPSDSLRLLNEMSVSDDPSGGILVSPDLSGRVATLVYETSPVRRLASVQGITTDALEGETDLNEAGASWVGETETRSGNSTTPEVGKWRIPVHEQYAEPRATQKFLDDSAVNVEAWLGGKVSGKFARAENTAFVTGDGVGKPRGFTTYTAGTPSASSWNQIQQVVSGSGTTLTAGGLLDLVFALKTAYRQGSVFGMNRSAEAVVRKLVDGQNNYLWQPDFQQMAASRLLGFPIEELPDMADIASNSLSIVFGNIGEAYQIVDRAGIRVLRDPYTTKGYVKFYTTKRVGGGVVNFEAIKLQKTST